MLQPILNLKLTWLQWDYQTSQIPLKGKYNPTLQDLETVLIKKRISYMSTNFLCNWRNTWSAVWPWPSVSPYLRFRNCEVQLGSVILGAHILYRLQKSSNSSSFPVFTTFTTCLSKASLKRWSLFIHSLNLSWPYDFLWPTENSGNDAVRILSSGLKRHIVLLLIHWDTWLHHKRKLGRPRGGWEGHVKESWAIPIIPDAIIDQPRRAVSYLTHSWSHTRVNPKEIRRIAMPIQGPEHNNIVHFWIVCYTPVTNIARGINHIYSMRIIHYIFPLIFLGN